MAEQKAETQEYELFISKEEHEFMHNIWMRLFPWVNDSREKFKIVERKHTEKCAICGDFSKELQEQCIAAMKEYELERHAASEGIAKRIFDKWIEASPFLVKSFIEILQIDLEYDERYLKRLSKIKEEIEKRNADTTMITAAIELYKNAYWSGKGLLEYVTMYLEKKKKE